MDSGSVKPAPDTVAAMNGVTGTSRCKAPRRAARTFVGLHEQMTLDDFERAALEASRVLSLLEVQGCALVRGPAEPGGLRAALESTGVEISAVHFTREDASAAEITLRRALPSGDAPYAGPTWLLAAKLVADHWQLHPRR